MSGQRTDAVGEEPRPSAPPPDRAGLSPEPVVVPQAQSQSTSRVVGLSTKTMLAAVVAASTPGPLQDPRYCRPQPLLRPRRLPASPHRAPAQRSGWSSARRSRCAGQQTTLRSLHRRDAGDPGGGWSENGCGARRTGPGTTPARAWIRSVAECGGGGVAVLCLPGALRQELGEVADAASVDVSLMISAGKDPQQRRAGPGLGDSSGGDAVVF